MRLIILTTVLLINNLVNGQSASVWFPENFLDTAAMWSDIRYPDSKHCAIQAVKMFRDEAGYYVSLKTNASEEFVHYKQKVSTEHGKKVFTFQEPLLISRSERFSDSFAMNASYRVLFDNEILVVEAKQPGVTRQFKFRDRTKGLVIKKPEVDLATIHLAQRYHAKGNPITVEILVTGKVLHSTEIKSLKITGIVKNPFEGFPISYKSSVVQVNGKASPMLVVISSDIIRLYRSEWIENSTKLKSVGELLLEWKKCR